MLWPSKLAVMNHVPRPILWVGDDQPLERATRFSPDDITGISTWVELQLNSPQALAYDPPKPQPEAALGRWEQWLCNRE